MTVYDEDNFMGRVNYAADCISRGRANDSIRQNEARHYTRSARLMYRAEQLPGFHWIER